MIADTSENPIDGEPVKSSANVIGMGLETGKTVTWESVETLRQLNITGVAKSTWLRHGTFGFGIPSGTTITGVALSLPYERSGSASLKAFVQLRVEEAFVGPLRTVALGTSPTGVIAASWDASDLAPLGLTPAKAGQPGFGFFLYIENASSGVAATFKEISTAPQMTVAYSEPSNQNKVCFASRSLEFSDGGVRRQHVTEDVWGELIPDGLDLQAPVPDQADQPMRVLIVPSVGDFAGRADSAAAKLSAKLWYRPGYLSAREASK